MAGVTWHYVLKFIITGEPAQSVRPRRSKELNEDAIVLQAMLRWASRRYSCALPTNAFWLIRIQRLALNVPLPCGSPFSRIAVGRSSESNSGRN